MGIDGNNAIMNGAGFGAKRLIVNTCSHLARSNCRECDHDEKESGDFVHCRDSS